MTTALDSYWTPLYKTIFRSLNIFCNLGYRTFFLIIYIISGCEINSLQVFKNLNS